MRSLFACAAMITALTAHVEPARAQNSDNLVYSSPQDLYARIAGQPSVPLDVVSVTRFMGQPSTTNSLFLTSARSVFVPLQALATTGDVANANASTLAIVNANATATASAVAGANAASLANANALAAIANRLDRLTDRFREGIALAGAINVLPPNPGDRFAVSFGGAGYDGVGGGSVAVSARIDESTLAYVGYARGPTQNLIKGGVGFSFR